MLLQIFGASAALIDVTFPQEVMLHKSRRFSRPIEDSFLEGKELFLFFLHCLPSKAEIRGLVFSLKALHENDHMTKVEVFHCAVCETFVSSSASSVRAHVMSQAHLTSIKVGLCTSSGVPLVDPLNDVLIS